MCVCVCGGGGGPVTPFTFRNSRGSNICYPGGEGGASNLFPRGAESNCYVIEPVTVPALDPRNYLEI